MTEKHKKDDNSKKMTWIAHLDELRWILVRCICAIAICSIPVGLFWKQIFDFIALMPLRLSDPVPQLIYTAPTEAVLIVFRIALTGGLIIASPYVFYQLWLFIAPALYKKEKILILPIVLASTICFLAGVIYCYFLLPLLLQFLTSFSAGQMEPYFKINEYLSFLIRTCLVFGIAFEMPIVAIMLRKMGLIDYRFLLHYFRHAIVVIFIIAAILTPPDVLSQIFLALPLLLLYSISVFLVFLVGKKN